MITLLGTLQSSVPATYQNALFGIGVPRNDSWLESIPLGDATGGFSASVEQWRDRVAKFAGDLPVEWLLAWISRESGGNVCSYTVYRESGIFQLMPGSNMTAGGTSEDALRPACSGQTATRQFTSDEMDEQVRSGIDYINNYARPTAQRFLDAAGVSWPENDSSGDFWKMVKMVFNLPGVIPGFLSNATAQLGHPPTSWAEMRSTINGYATSLDNAEWVGQYGAGGGSAIRGFVSSSAGAIFMAILGIGAGVLAGRWVAKRYLHAA